MLKAHHKHIYILFYKILKEYEQINLKDKTNPVKLFNILPQRTSLIPKHITLDSEILIQNFKDKIKLNINEFPKNIINVEMLRRDFVANQDTLWELMFNTKIKINNNYKFDYLIKTDGIACSLQYKFDDGKVKGRFIKGQKKDTKINKQEKPHKNIQYVDDVLMKNRFVFANKKIVCIDPNKSDLIYAGKYDNNKKITTFRYTNNQRKKEKKTKKYRKICKKIEDVKEITLKGEKKSVTKISSEKSNYNKKTNNKIELEKYIREMEKIDEILEEHYKSSVYRKLKMNTYINTQRSESRLINNFKNKMGSNKDTIVVVGDNGLKDVVVKGLESTISKRIIDIFVKNKYETYIIDEFRTSKLCNGCGKILEKFLEVESKKPNSKGKKYYSYGILRCQSSATCNVIHNRDKNAVTNMLKIIEHYKLTGKRLPSHAR